jgi:hypothetical protein
LNGLKTELKHEGYGENKMQWQDLETSRGISARNRGHIHNYVHKPEGFHAKSSDWTGFRESNISRGFLQDLQDTRK